MEASNHRRRFWYVLGLFCVMGISNCAGSKLIASKPAPPSIPPPAGGSVEQVAAKNRPEDIQFRSYVAAHPNLTAADVLAMVPKRAYLEALNFDPSTVPYYNETTDALQLTANEKDILRKRGFVSVDFRQRFSMASAYYGIYTRDLPVLITTDSITHALHRSFDEMLKRLEEKMFSHSLSLVLDATHEQLLKESAGISDSTLITNIRDVDLYLSVARALLAGDASATSEDETSEDDEEKNDDDDNVVVKPLNTSSRFGQDALVKTIVSLASNASDSGALPIYGGQRSVDFTQFRPRGHYTESEALKRYFRTMMWLGRADTGWFLLPIDPASGLQIDANRERRNAAMMSYVMDKSGQLPRLGAMSKVIDFLVGRSDNLSIDTMKTIFPRVQFQRLTDLANPTVAQRLEQSVRELGLGTQRIRSQTLRSNPEKLEAILPPMLFQVFGQRFVIDSFVLSNVVFDSIEYEEQKQQRMMPQGLDVFAALGNEEALRLLEPELKQWKYGTNLMAARSVVESYAPEKWNESVYNTWLDALRTLDDEFPPGVEAPQLMRTQAWQHKQLQTQLASWAELRHDTILYAKPSYGSGALCEYPAGYVEPYPRFFERLGFLARETSRLIGTVNVSDPEPETAQEQAELQKRMADFWTNFATVMKQLETLAQKELDAKPFTAEELAFVKKTIDIRGGGSGPPQYDGWYPKLIFADEPSTWKPTIADVHTGFEEDGAKALEVGVGDATLLVAAIDNQGDKMVYVGPMSSYYEFEHPANDRLTDERWGAMVSTSKVPPRPAWTSSFQPQLEPPATSREFKRNKL